MAKDRQGASKQKASIALRRLVAAMEGNTESAQLALISMAPSLDETERAYVADGMSEIIKHFPRGERPQAAARVICALHQPPRRELDASGQEALHWEYRLEHISVAGSVEDSAEACALVLNRLGQTGWQLVSALPLAPISEKEGTTRFLGIFKRPFVEAQPALGDNDM